MIGKHVDCKCDPPCGVKPGNYRKKFFERFPDGWPTNRMGIADQPGWYKCPKCNEYLSKDHMIPPKCIRPALQIDHIIPKKSEKGGKIHCIGNLRPTCWACNIKKSNNEKLKHRILSGNPRLIQWIERTHSKAKKTGFKNLPTRAEIEAMPADAQAEFVEAVDQLADGDVEED